MTSAQRGAAAAGVAVICLALWAAPALACSVCYGQEANSSPLITAAKLGVFLLLGITVVLLASFAKFFFYLRNRARQFESESLVNEWAQLQRSSPL